MPRMKNVAWTPVSPRRSSTRSVWRSMSKRGFGTVLKWCQQRSWPKSSQSIVMQARAAFLLSSSIAGGIDTPPESIINENLFKWEWLPKAPFLKVGAQRQKLRLSSCERLLMDDGRGLRASHDSEAADHGVSKKAF